MKLQSTSNHRRATHVDAPGTVTAHSATDALASAARPTLRLPPLLDSLSTASVLVERDAEALWVLDEVYGAAYVAAIAVLDVAVVGGRVARLGAHGGHEAVLAGVQRCRVGSALSVDLCAGAA